MTKPPENSLYRQEAIAHAGQQSFGSAMIQQPLSLKIMTLFIFFVAAAIFGFLNYGEYARKVTVSGYLEPNRGVSRVYPRKTGIAEQIFFEDAELVEKGQPLVRIKIPYLLADGEEAHEQIISELIAQKKELELSVGRGYDKYLLDDNWYRAKILSLREEHRQIIQVQTLQVSRSKIVDEQRHSIKKLREGNFASSFQMLQIEVDYINEQKERLQLSQRQTQIEAEILHMKHQLKSLPVAAKDRKRSLTAELSDLNQRITEARGQSAYQIMAPVAGRITANNIRVGEPVTLNKPIVAILPQNAELFAWLLVPSRAAGFIRDGQHVRLMYDSFPYQQFGTQAGTIISMSNAIINPNDIRGPNNVREPVFLAKVRLSKSSITAFGEEQLLQTDMALTADIIQAKRSILDWMLEPLYTLRGTT